jgi:hypothetical protein
VEWKAAFSNGLESKLGCAIDHEHGIFDMYLPQGPMVLGIERLTRRSLRWRTDEFGWVDVIDIFIDETTELKGRPLARREEKISRLLFQDADSNRPSPPDAPIFGR